ncbi:terpene synthase [Nocardia elegans]|uniref:Terpene synthase n=1 Tax=Nocardia elegans TaxID=300029 RepID=A0ABW6TEE0_9NOCA|nr:terpene synthase family protein [Nocardia elegans]MBF6447315.1 terpene synthase [Nocardia elegans]
MPQIASDIAAMHAQYQELLHGDRWSLRALFSTDDCDIAQYCSSFRPNRFGAQACAEVEAFCRRHRIWLERGGAAYNSMTPYLHPRTISLARMTTIGIYNAILFALNDTVGREKFGHLSEAERAQAQLEVDRLCRLFESGRIRPDNSTPIVEATVEFLTTLTDQAEPVWLERFRASTIDHLRSAIRDQNVGARGDLLSVDDYINLRNEVSGMYPAIQLCEFARDTTLPWDRLAAAGLAEDLRTLERLTAEVGALMNDVFSFEKEVIVDRSDFNLISILLLNTPGATLADAVLGAAQIVRERLTDFRRLRQDLLDRCPALSPPLATAVTAYADDLDQCVQASWVWQCATSRYKGRSIFVEAHHR